MKFINKRSFLFFTLIYFLSMNLFFNLPEMNAQTVPEKKFERMIEHAYLDFSYIGYIIQIAIGGLVGVLFALRRYYSSIVSFMRNKFRPQDKEFKD